MNDKPKFETPKGEIRAKRMPKGKQVMPKGSGRTRGRRDTDTESQRGDKGVKFNPVEWYTKYKDLAEAASTLGFNHVKGIPYYHLLKYGLSQPNDPDLMEDVPVVRVGFLPSAGYANDSTSAINMQIRKLYLAIRRKYRGLNTYEPADLAEVVFSVGNLYLFIAKLERIYGICKWYSAVNRTMPNNLPGALRFNYRNLTEHLADFRYGINSLITRAQSLVMPAGMDFVNRWFLLESNIFKDSENERASYIAFDFDELFVHQPTVFLNGGSAVLANFVNSFDNPESLTYVDLLQVGEDILDLLLNDNEVTLIMGDLVSFLSPEGQESQLLTLSPLPEDYMVTPVYNQDVLLQLHNACFVGLSTNLGTQNGAGNTYRDANWKAGPNNTLESHLRHAALTQIEGLPHFVWNIGNKNDSVDNGLYYDQTTMSSANLTFKPGNQLLDTWEDAPSADRVIEATRFMVYIDSKYHQVNTDYFYKFVITACGTELLTYMELFDCQDSDQGTTTLFSVRPNTIVANNFARLSKIDWHHYVYLIDIYQQTKTQTTHFTFENFVVGDVDNARVLTYDLLHYIHDAAIMSLFEVPAASK